MKRTLPFLSFLFLNLAGLFAQMGPERSFQIPVKIPPQLSGNFGELRTNHFHTGIDFKTQGQVGKDIFCFDHGWVSRIVVSPWGYGNAIYVTHYNGLTTVYAHLLDFEKKIAERVNALHYEKEQFNLDVSFEKDEIQVRKGEVIARSGNTGSSGGPHLHFEIRNTETEEAMDPLPYFVDKIKDTTPPQLRQIRLYASDSSVVNGKRGYVTTTPLRTKEGEKKLNKALSAWGKVYVGVKSYDKMDGLHHIYGVKQVRLYVDDSLHFSIDHKKVAFSDNRSMNSFIDYNDWVKNRSMMMRLLVDPGNRLKCYTQATDHGYIQIDEERSYRCRIELMDLYGNKTTWPFVIEGKMSEIPPYTPTEGSVKMHYDLDNLYKNEYVALKIGKGMLYRSINFTYDSIANKKGYSRLHRLHDIGTPLHGYCDVSIVVENDTLENKNQYYLAKVHKGHGRYVSATYDRGVMKGRIRDLGDYEVRMDDTKPTITPIGVSQWGKRGIIRFKITDKESGIKTYRGEIDGKFALFSFDGKSASLAYRIDSKRVKRGKKHQLKLTVVDNCGNENVYEHSLYW